MQDDLLLRLPALSCYLCAARLMRDNYDSLSNRRLAFVRVNNSTAASSIAFRRKLRDDGLISGFRRRILSIWSDINCSSKRSLDLDLTVGIDSSGKKYVWGLMKLLNWLELILEELNDGLINTARMKNIVLGIPNVRHECLTN